MARSIKKGFFVDYHLLEKIQKAAKSSGARKPIQHMVEQRLAVDRHQRLRHLLGERLHAFAEACGENHRGCGNDRAALIRHSSLLR